MLVFWPFSCSLLVLTLFFYISFAIFSDFHLLFQLLLPLIMCLVLCAYLIVFVVCVCVYVRVSFSLFDRFIFVVCLTHFSSHSAVQLFIQTKVVCLCSASSSSSFFLPFIVTKRCVYTYICIVDFLFFSFDCRCLLFIAMYRGKWPFLHSLSLPLSLNEKRK